MKLFILVDGLDEYEGEHSTLATLFKELSSLSNVKICVSSRPLLVFEKAFKGLPSLRLEYLTHEDIQLYVSKKLGGDAQMESPRHQAVDREVEAILTDVVQKANGDFLWVEIVVKFLLAGLTNEDKLSDLRARVDALPTELEGLYEHMMSNISSVYRQGKSFIASFDQPR